MFVKIDDFVLDWTQEAELTERVLDALTDNSLHQPVADQYRSLGEIAWHLVESIQYMSGMGLSFEGPSENKEVTISADFIANEYRRLSGSMLDAIQTQWTDETLKKETEMGGEQWTNGALLRFSLMHQAHHRGQMTILMRQASLRIPGVYGPTREDWIDQGVEPLK